MEKGWTSVFESSDEYLVSIAKDLLENSGIESVVLNHKDSSYLIFGEAEVYVTDQDEKQAREILKQLKKD
ncbi:MAG: DUF2007 domain-containing protein [Mariniphaga sp.]